MAGLQDYDALRNLWASLNSTDIAANLGAINSAVVGQDDNGNNILWPQSYGWNGPVNQNDLVPAGIITAAQRIQFELEQGLITQTQASRYLAQLQG